MVDQQEALERLRELYREKNEHLEKFLEPVDPYEFIERSSRKDLSRERAILRTGRETELR
nr:hypothetical protein [Clostridium sp. AM51-4]